MESGEANNDTVHPEVRAHINSLVSALGGFDFEDGTYRLGDDALECLRDLKRWIRFYDEKTNRMDVARSLADANLVGGDLLHIMALWPDNCADADEAAAAGAGSANKNMRGSRFKARLALACLEIMVPLTWPIERDRATMTVNHYRHIPVLQLAQVGYKRAIVNFDGAHILRTTVRAALPAMATPIGDRTARDHGVIKLMLFLLRNVAMIAPPAGVEYDGDESQISRSAVIDAFSFQDVLLTLLTIASNMGDDFRTEDTTVMEILFHLVKRVGPEKLFMQEKELSRAKADELTAALGKEAAMLRAYNKNAPTRHSRFGTMIWVKRESGKLSTVTGQEALLDQAARERKMDSSKTFRAPKYRARKEEMDPVHLGPPVSLNARANQQLRSFVEEFLDSGFNPLFGHVTASIEREAPHVLAYHRPQFFYLVAWFLEAERLRRKAKPNAQQKAPQPAQGEDEIGTYNLVAEVLNQKMFIALNRALSRAFNDKEWQELAAVMRCLTQILITVQEMSESPNEEDQEIAENTLSRLFYEEATHDAIAGIARSYKDQGFEYLDSATELIHTFLRILEAYSKQNVDLQVRSRMQKRRRQKKQKTAAQGGAEGAGEGDAAAPVDDDDDDEASAADEATAARTTRERKFDFTRFSARFADQGVVNTFVAFTKYYRDLDAAQLKRAHRFFYRIAFKQELGVTLCRLDIIHMLYNMIKGPEPLRRDDKVLAASFKEWEELVKQILRKCVRKLQERPALFVELLFSKTSSTAMYLEYGHERQTMSSRGSANPRPGAELEFKGLVDDDRQVAIAVGALLDKNEADHISWVKAQLGEAEKERRAWEVMEKAMPSVEAPATGATEQAGEAALPTHDAAGKRDMMPITVRADNAARRKAMFKNAHLRLLMKLVGMERFAPILDETPESTWVFPANRTADELKHSLDLIQQAEFSPPTFDDAKSAADQLRRKSAARRKARGEDDEDGGGGEGRLAGFLDDDDDDKNADGDDADLDSFLFAKGGPTARQALDENGQPIKRKKRLSRRKKEVAEGEDEEEDGEDDSEKAARARARRQKELEKLRKIKSAMFVTLSDDETDEERDREFFEQERRRQQTKDSTFGLVSSAAAQTGAKGKKKNNKQDRDSAAEDDAGEERTEWEMLLDVDSDDDDDDKENAPVRGEKEDGEGDTKAKKAAKASGPKAARSRPRKRKSPAAASARDSDEEAEAGRDSDASARQVLPSRKKRKSVAPRKAATTRALLDDDSDSSAASAGGMDKGDDNANGETEDMAVVDLLLPSNLGPGEKAMESRAGDNRDDDNADEDEDDMPVTAAVKTRGKARAGFIIDSSDEE